MVVLNGLSHSLNITGTVYTEHNYNVSDFAVGISVGICEIVNFTTIASAIIWFSLLLLCTLRFEFLVITKICAKKYPDKVLKSRWWHVLRKRVDNPLLGRIEESIQRRAEFSFARRRMNRFLFFLHGSSFGFSLALFFSVNYVLITEDTHPIFCVIQATIEESMNLLGLCSLNLIFWWLLVRLCIRGYKNFKLPNEVSSGQTPQDHIEDEENCDVLSCHCCGLCMLEIIAYVFMACFIVIPIVILFETGQFKVDTESGRWCPFISLWYQFAVFYGPMIFSLFLMYAGLICACTCHLSKCINLSGKHWWTGDKNKFPEISLCKLWFYVIIYTACWMIPLFHRFYAKYNSENSVLAILQTLSMGFYGSANMIFYFSCLFKELCYHQVKCLPMNSDRTIRGFRYFHGKSPPDTLDHFALKDGDESSSRTYGTDDLTESNLSRRDESSQVGERIREEQIVIPEDINDRKEDVSEVFREDDEEQDGETIKLLDERFAQEEEQREEMKE